jgi:hypothetical protein
MTLYLEPTFFGHVRETATHIVLDKIYYYFSTIHTVLRKLDML